MKACKECGESKKLEEYKARRAICRLCKNARDRQRWANRSVEQKQHYSEYRKEYLKQYNKDNVEQLAIKKTARDKLRLYGLTVEQWEFMSRNGCMICGSFDNLSVDHDHSCCSGIKSCGKCIRGALCRKHNMLLGMANDSVLELSKCIDYLKRF